MPFFLLVAGSAAGFGGVGLTKPVFCRTRRQPFIDPQTVAPLKIGILQAVDIHVGTPVVTGTTRHRTVSQNDPRAFFRVYYRHQILSLFANAAVPFVFPNFFLALKIACRRNDRKPDTFFFSCISHGDKRLIGFLPEVPSYGGPRSILWSEPRKSHVRSRAKSPES